jgi:hypothetical protein
MPHLLRRLPFFTRSRQHRFKQIEEAKFLKENYFVRFHKVEAAKDQGP